jgi:hypothetical protein
MQVGEFFVYLMLTIILIALIGVLMWLVYDYGNLKNILSSNFNIIGNKFSSHKTTDNTLDENIKTNTSNFNDEIKNTSNYISSVSSNSSNYVDLIAYDSSNYVESTSNDIEQNVSNIDTEIQTFSDNLDKYFVFGKNSSAINSWNENSANKRLFDFTTTTFDSDDENKYLELVNDTLIAGEVTMGKDVTMEKNVTMKGDVKICPTDATDDTKCLTINTDSSGNISINAAAPNKSIKIGNRLTITDTTISWAKDNPVEGGARIETSMVPS